jgi:hypothetical protein
MSDKIFSDMLVRRRYEKNSHINKNEYSSLDSIKRHIKINHNSVASD